MHLWRDDIFVEGDCDESIKKLCARLGWEKELAEQNQKTQIKPKSTKTMEKKEEDNKTDTKEERKEDKDVKKS